MSDYYIERIQRGVDFVEARLDQDVALADVARAAGLSQWHFQRIFRSLTGETLKTYIRARRLSSSLTRLVETDLRVLDVAVMAGFESQEAFARAFKKAFGMTPSEYRDLGRGVPFARKLRVEDIREAADGLSLEPQIERRPAMTLVGARTVVYGRETDQSDIGRVLPPLWAAFLPRRFGIPSARTDICYGVVRQDADEGERLEYFAAVEVEASLDEVERVLPEGMRAVSLPASTYARFDHRGDASLIDHTVTYAYSSWLVRSGRRHTGEADLEIYGAEYHATDPASVFSYALPIEA